MIVIVCPQLWGVHGIARYVQSLLQAWPNPGPAVRVLCERPAHPPEAHGPWPAAIEWVFPPGPARAAPAAPPTRWLRGGLLRWSWWARSQIRRWHDAAQVEVVMLHTPPLIPAWWLLCAPGHLPAELPTVLTVHTTDTGMCGQALGPQAEPLFAQPYGSWSLTVRQGLERRIFAAASKVITLTPLGAAEVARYGRTEGVQVIPNGAQLAQFHPLDLAQALSAQHRRRGSSQGPFDVLIAGRLEPRKGSRALLPACRALVASRPTLRIALAGTGEELPALRGLLQALSPGIEVLGAVPMSQMPALYRRARVALSTSYYEGLPGTCLEAMASGVPPVVWDLPFYDGLVDHERTGLRVPVNDFVAMARAVGRLLDDRSLAHRLGRAAAERVRTRHDWHRLAPQIVDLALSARSVSA